MTESIENFRIALAQGYERLMSSGFFVPSWVIVLIVLVVLFLIYLISKQKQDSHNKILKDIKEVVQYSVSPKFVNFNPEASDLSELAIDVWRLEKRLDKVVAGISEEQKSSLTNSVQRMRRYLEKNDIEIIDPVNQKFNEGLNLEVLSIEKDSSVGSPIIKETVEPTIMYKGQILRKAKVIVLDKQI